jgi:PAS domain S-box-containing protein
MDAAELAALCAIGDEFFRSMVRNLSLATGVANAFIAEFADLKTKIRTIAFWMNGEFVENREWELAGTPCEEVVRGHFCHYPSGVWQQFPKEAGIESYLGVPLQDSEDGILEHLAIFDSCTMPSEPRLLFIFQIFAARAAAELRRIRVEQQLRESDERFRDLFDEAPIAYVHEDVKSRFIRANRAAMNILGITPEQVPGTIGISLVPDTPDAQRRVKEAFASVGRGTDTSGGVLELRRKDNGKPIRIQWWSNP